MADAPHHPKTAKEMWDSHFEWWVLQWRDGSDSLWELRENKCVA